MIARFVAMIIALGSGTVASQLPEFSQQYRQRLGGAIDELRVIVEDFDEAAKKFGMQREDALRTYQAAEGGFLPERGEQMRQTIDRYEFLEAHNRKLESAGPFQRIVTMLQEQDQTIAREAFDDYEPAVPVTTEGVVHAGAGFAVGLGAMFVLSRLLRLGRRRRKPDDTIAA